MQVIVIAADEDHPTSPLLRRQYRGSTPNWTFRLKRPQRSDAPNTRLQRVGGPTPATRIRHVGFILARRSVLRQSGAGDAQRHTQRLLKFAGALESIVGVDLHATQNHLFDLWRDRFVDQARRKSANRHL